MRDLISGEAELDDEEDDESFDEDDGGNRRRRPAVEDSSEEEEDDDDEEEARKVRFWLWASKIRHRGLCADCTGSRRFHRRRG